MPAVSAALIMKKKVESLDKKTPVYKLLSKLNRLAGKEKLEKGVML